MSEVTDIGMAIHPDDLAVDAFAAALKTRLAERRSDPDHPLAWRDGSKVADGHLGMLLVRSVDVGGDPLEVGMLAMMVHQRGERIAGERERYAAVVKERRRRRDGASDRIDVA